MDPRPGRPRRALIAGAGIAGPALAHWLGRYGWETVVVERATGVRAGGQNIDVRGAGREVTRRMGLEQAVHDATTGEVGTRFVTADGVTVAEFPAGTSQSGGTTAEVEILREDLANLLVARTRDRTDYVFDDRVVGVRDEGGHVRVALERGAEREVDVVVAADGLHSSTRSLVFGPTATVTPLGAADGVADDRPDRHRRPVVAVVQRSRRARRHAPARQRRHDSGSAVLPRRPGGRRAPSPRAATPAARRRLRRCRVAVRAGARRRPALPGLLPRGRRAGARAPVEPRPGGPARRRCLRPVTGQWHGHEPRARRRLRARR